MKLRSSFDFAKLLNGSKIIFDQRTIRERGSRQNLQPSSVRDPCFYFFPRFRRDGCVVVQDRGGASTMAGPPLRRAQELGRPKENDVTP